MTSSSARPLLSSSCTSPSVYASRTSQTPPPLLMYFPALLLPCPESESESETRQILKVSLVMLLLSVSQSQAKLTVSGIIFWI